MQRLTAALADRYTIERELGAGGMATVYLAEDVKHHRKVAIKVLHPELTAVLGPDRFLQEIELTASLQHPHILPLFDSGAGDGVLYYVMPYVEGETLRGRLQRESQLSIADTVRIATEVADALEYAHKRNVIHRDIKPENLLLHDGRALVADFGIALAVEQAGGTRMTQTGISLGTPQYMAPEQAMGEKSVDGRADIYALGAVTYEMLTGEPPFTGPTAQAIVAKVMTQRPRSIVSLRDTTPPYVDDAVMLAMQKLPADRFATAKEFADALHGSPSGATRRTMTGRAAAPAHAVRQRLRDPVTVALAAVAVLALTAVGWLRSRLAAVPPPVPVTFAITASDGVPPIRSLNTWPAVVSPDGRILVYLGAAGSGGWQFYVRRLGQLEVQPLPGTEGASQPIFSPDSKWLAFESGSRLSKVPLDGGAPIALADASWGDGAAWSPTGAIILGADGIFAGLTRVPDGGGKLLEFTHPDTSTHETHLWPLVLDDGKTIVLTVESGVVREGARLALTSLDDGVVHPLGVVGLRALGVVAGQLVYLQADGNVMAIPFDARRHQVQGSPVLVLDSIALCHTCNGDAPVYLSRSGALAYIRGSETSRLAWVSADGATRLLGPAGRTLENPRLSPDGRRIAVTDAAGRLNISIFDMTTGALTPLTSAGDNYAAEWSADGSNVAFISDRTGQPAIWRQPANFSDTAVRMPGTTGANVREGLSLSPDNATVLWANGGV